MAARLLGLQLGIPGQCVVVVVAVVVHRQSWRRFPAATESTPIAHEGQKLLVIHVQKLLLRRLVVVVLVVVELLGRQEGDRVAWKADAASLAARGETCGSPWLRAR